MLFKSFTAIVLPILTARYARADCDKPPNTVDPNAPLRQETDTTLCLPQGENAWTFAMSTSLACVPGGTSGNGLAGCAGGQYGIWIYDNNCNIRGSYDKPACAPPYTIMENFLPWVLTITSIDWLPGSTEFHFLYGNGEYITAENQCGCQSVGDSPAATIHCKCAFPLDGNAPVSRVRRGLLS